MGILNLYLDDIRNPQTEKDWNVVRSFDEAIEFMEKNGCPHYMSFDHDLGDEVPTGKDVAQWMVEKDIADNGTFIPDCFQFNVHSANPVGRDNIIGLLTNYINFKQKN